jgi:hypothetical protein
VTRKLVNLCLALTLVLGCWGGVLAAAACPHAGCKTAASAPEVTAGHGEHTGDHGHDVVGPEDHSGHGEAHEGHTAQPSEQDRQHFSPEQFTGVASNRHDQNCAHCVGSTEAPPSRSFEWQSNSLKQGGKLLAPQASGRIVAPAAVFVREITPAQHAPPGRSDRHLLFSVFRI